MMIMWESSLYLGKKILWSARERISTKAMKGREGLCVIIKIMLKMTLNTVKSINQSSNII